MSRARSTSNMIPYGMDKWLKVALAGLGAGALTYLLVGVRGSRATPLVLYAATGADAPTFAGVGSRVSANLRVEPVPYRQFSDLQSAINRVEGPVSPLVLIGHGTTTAFFSNLDRPSPVELASAIGGKLAHGAVIGLAGCRAGASPGEPDWVPQNYGPGGENSYAAQLRDELVRQGVRSFEVRAHSTTGSSVANPVVRTFRSQAGTKGDSALDLLWGAGSWLSAAARSAWTAAVQGKQAEGYIAGGPLPQIARPA